MILKIFFLKTVLSEELFKRLKRKKERKEIERKEVHIR